MVTIKDQIFFRYRIFLIHALIIFFWIWQTPHGACSEITKRKDIVNISSQFINLISTEDFTNCSRFFTQELKRTLPVKKLSEIWDKRINYGGAFIGQVDYRKSKYGKFDIVFATCKFEKDFFDIKLVFNNHKQIAGLFFIHSKPISKYRLPSYVNTRLFEDREVTIESGEWDLPGTLSIPNKSVQMPVVVLVHGSGPNDRDETIGASKPFRDIAWGLASNGIAVLRYDKRTWAHISKISDIMVGFTVNEETVDDALSAILRIKNCPDIDASKIFVLGHSRGGRLIPRIGARSEGVKGFIVMAGPTRPLEDILIDQIIYKSSLDGKITLVEKRNIQLAKARAARVKDPSLSVHSSTEGLPFSLPPSYWLDLRHYHAPTVAKHLEQPFLILQGGRDYQVTVKDFEGWKKTLSNRSNVTFILYPQLNHLFIEGKKKSAPAEYKYPGNVSGKVIKQISDWIKKNS